MKKFAKILAVLVSLFFVFFALGCKDDSDDDEQSYLLEGGIISKTVYEKFRYSSSQIDQCRAECLLYTKAGTYEKESFDEEDLTSELEGLTASQIQLIKESDALIQYFTFTENSDYVIWLYSQKE